MSYKLNQCFGYKRFKYSLFLKLNANFRRPPNEMMLFLPPTFAPSLATGLAVAQEIAALLPVCRKLPSVITLVE